MSNTRKIFFTGDKYSSDDAMDMEIFDFIYEQKDILKKSLEFSEKISLNAPLSLASIKKSINTFESSQSINPDDYKKIKETILRAANSSDYLEAQNAFKEKRSPNFSGK